MTARFIVGDVFEVLAGIPDSSVDLVLTSPPFLALRSYLPELAYSRVGMFLTVEEREYIGSRPVVDVELPAS